MSGHSWLQAAGIGVAGLLGVGILCLFVVAIEGGRSKRSEQSIRKWCAEHRFALQQLERRYIFCGPFLCSPNGTTIYRIVVTDPAGQTRQGWARCGGWFFGALLSDEVRVIWS